jgi:hypothetical protein
MRIIQHALCPVREAVLLLFVIAANAGAAGPARPLSAGDPFDTSVTATLSGVVYAVKVPTNSPHIYLIVEVDAGHGTRARWAIQGDAADVLVRNGWPRPVRRGVTPGEKVAATVYRPKRGAASLDRSVPADQTDILELAKAGRLAYGIELTHANGSRLFLGAR